MSIKVKVEVEELTNDQMIDILSAMDYSIHYWVKMLSTWPMEYERAAKLYKQSIHSSEEPTYEDILLYVLKSGGKLLIELYEKVEGKNEYFLTLEGIKEGLSKGMTIGHISTAISQWDAHDYDAVIQFSLFGELIFG